MRLAKRALLLLSLVLLSGCAKESIVATVEPFCEGVAHVCISRDDRLTDGTATQIEANNLGRAKLCVRPKGEDPCAGMRTKPAAGAKVDQPTS